jgi:hypothetical protein
MAKIAMLWFHNPMTGVQRLSIRSFLHHGHDVTIFTYGAIEAPDGVSFADAGEIISEDKIFKSHDSFAAFSDVFRYRLLAQTDFIWADADTVCLRPDWNFNEYLFSFQEPFKVTNNVLGYPQGSQLAKRLVDECVYQEGKAYEELGLGGYVLPSETFNPLHWTHYSAPFNEALTADVFRKCEGSHAVSLSNYLLKYHGFDRDNFPPGSAIALWNETFR